MAKDKSKIANKSIIEKYGEIIGPAPDLVNRVKSIIPISPSIDLAVHGGAPEGSLITLAGPPGCGKSTTALQIIKNALDILYDGIKRKAFYTDVEHRLKPMNLSGVDGLDPNDIQLIRSTPEKILSAQEFLDVNYALMTDKENKGGIFVIDSSSALCPADEMAADTSGTIRTTQPKVMSHFCKKIAPVLQIMDCTLIMIQHLITNTSGYGEKYIVDGGEKLKYQTDIRLVTKGKPEIWMNGDTPIGQIIEWDVLKSAMGHPHLSAKSYLRYGAGLDSLKEQLTMAVELGIINKTHAWFSYKDRKMQGEEKLYTECKNDSKLREEIIAELKTFIG